MLKLPKGLKKKKKGKKSKRKGEEELFTEEELEKYRREHQQQQAQTTDGLVKENEEWSKFKDLTTGIDSVLKKTQGDLDRIKSTSFFQRVQPKEPEPEVKETSTRPVVEVTEADFPQLAPGATAGADDADDDRSEFAATDDESEADEQDDIFDTSYVEAVERGEVKLAYVPDSPEDFQDDGLFDTSHVDALIKGQENKSKGDKKTLDIGVAVEVLTGRIDNLTLTTKKRKRVIPGDLLLESNDAELPAIVKATAQESEPVETSILDADTDVPITSPIDLSVSLHTSLIQQSKKHSQENIFELTDNSTKQWQSEEEEDDEFTLLATESLESKPEAIKLEEKEIEPVIKESWSAFEADKNECVFAEGIVEDQIEVLDPYIDQDDPFDTSFAEAVIPSTQIKSEPIILEEDEDFDPRAEEIQARLNNRRKSSVRIHLTNPLGIRESITSDEIIDAEESKIPRDLLGGSNTDLTQLGDSPLDPLDANSTDIDPFDTTIVDKVVAPGKVELKLLEQELIGASPAPIYRVPSDPDFDPRADEPKQTERRASRPENLTVSKSVVFNVEGEIRSTDSKPKPIKPLTPYYTRELSITEDLNESGQVFDKVTDTLTKTRSDEDLTSNIKYQTKRRHSEYPQQSVAVANFKGGDLLNTGNCDIQTKVLTPTGPQATGDYVSQIEEDPFDTSFAADIQPSKTELKLLAKELDVDVPKPISGVGGHPDLLEPSDDLFQVKALTPEPADITQSQEDFDPFDTSFATALNPGKTELKLLESEFLN